MTENEPSEYFGITLMREAIDLFEQGVIQGLTNPDDPMPAQEAWVRMNSVNRLVKLAATWFEQNLSDESGSYDLTLRFLKSVYSDLLAEGLEEFIKFCDKKKTWEDQDSAPLWSAGVTYVYLKMVRIIRDDDSKLRQTLSEMAPA